MRNQSNLAVAVVFISGFAVFGSPSSAAAQDSSEVWVPAAQNVHYFAVRVEDVDRAAAWYKEVFGVRSIGGSEAADGAWQIENLMNDFLHVEIIRDDRARVVERARGFFKVGFRVPDVEQVADRIGTATGERPRVLRFEEHGVRIIQFRDPDGNTIQLSSALAD